MLIEYSVSNFRSFRERQVFSLVAAPRLRWKRNVFSPKVLGESLPDLLKVAVIYGPNASGKSNLLKALAVIRDIARRSPASTNPLPIAPFRFDPALLHEPSNFEVHFIADGIRYQFELSATSERIFLERLIAFPKGNEALLYERQYKGGAEHYIYGPQFVADKELRGAWQKLTPSKSLFISQAVANSSDEITQLRAPYEWLRMGVLSVLNGMRSMSRGARDLAANSNNKHAEDLAEFLSQVDIPISKITVEGKKEKRVNIESEAEEERIVAGKTTLTHTTGLGDGEVDFDDESEGTKNLIGFWLPWETRLYKRENIQRTLSVDELDSSLHPKIVEELVSRHINSEDVSQLIFTTHDTHLMDSKLLRRDQIWIVERNSDGATRLKSVYEYKGREGEDVEKRYFEGKYRGLPLLRRMTLVNETESEPDTHDELSK